MDLFLLQDPPKCLLISLNLGHRMAPKFAHHLSSALLIESRVVKHLAGRQICVAVNQRATIPQSEDVDVTACRETVVDFVRCVCMAVSNDLVVGVSQLASLVPVVGLMHKVALVSVLFSSRVCFRN